MDKIVLSPQGALRNGLTLDEAIMLLVVNNKIDIYRTLHNLNMKSYIGDINTSPTTYFLMDEGRKRLEGTIVDSDNVSQPPDILYELAKELKEIFPKGKKPGTNYYWADSAVVITKRLKLFFKKYGNDYTPEQILDAAHRYVESFNSNYTYMKLLKYFILKDKKGADGDIENESELANYIENVDQEEERKEIGGRML